MKRNKGFTIIEMLVVIAVMSAGLALVSASISSLTAAAVRKCAVDLNSMLARCKVNTMYRAQPIVVVLIENGRVVGEYYEGGNLISREILASRTGFDVRIRTGAGLHAPLTEGQSVVLGFERGTGALLSLNDYDANERFWDGADNPLEDIPNPIIAGNATAVVIQRGTAQYTITLVPTTGRHSVRRTFD